MNKNTKPAIITATIAAGSSSSPYYVDCNITQMLCRKTCKDDVPVFSPSFSILSFSQVATGDYIVTVHVEGVISYTPCGCGTCVSVPQIISQDFTIPVRSVAAISQVTITAGTSVNAIACSSCQNCSNVFVCQTPLTLAVTTA